MLKTPYVCLQTECWNSFYQYLSMHWYFHVLWGIKTWIRHGFNSQWVLSPLTINIWEHSFCLRRSKSKVLEILKSEMPLVAEIRGDDKDGYGIWGDMKNGKVLRRCLQSAMSKEREIGENNWIVHRKCCFWRKGRSQILRGQERSFDLILEAMTSVYDIFIRKNSLYCRKTNLPIEFSVNWNEQRHKSGLFLLQEHR